ncbi:MAG: hypothetical protein M3P18_00395 [Actinomycetota bacterium]|nr:hypothetical protein [Actinomycetota bacterium]
MTPVVSSSKGVIVRRRRSTSEALVEGFDWGGLNSDSRWLAAWVFLIPFTMVNVAGWADPSSRDDAPSKFNGLMQLMVLIQGWVLTVTVALWLADLLIDYVGYQWVPRALGADAGLGQTIHLIGSWSLALSTKTARVIGVGVGGVMALVILVALGFLAGRTKRDSGEPRSNARGFERRGDLRDPGFFDRRASWAAAKLMHLVLASSALAIVLIQAIVALNRFPMPHRTSADLSLVVAGAVQLVLLVFMGAISGVRARKLPGAGVAWSFTVMAFALTDAFLAGLVLWVAKYLGSHPDRPSGSGLVLGRELSFVDVFLLVVVAWALIIGAVALHRTRIRGVPDPCSLDAGASDAVRSDLARGQGTARIIHKIDRLVITLAAVFVAIAVSFAVWRARPVVGASWHLPILRQTGWDYAAASWLLPLFVVFVVARVRKASSDNRLRRFIGQAWDVLSFWPRRFHPFAVRPYTHIAVPALRRRIETLLEGGPMLISAHSQGTALTVAALAPLRELSDVNLVTYGSHIGTLYRRGFPAHFNDRLVNELCGRLGHSGETRWANFYRLTDPIGGPLFVGEDGALDLCLPDPADISTYDDTDDPPLERNREPTDRLAVHSYYLQEPELKARVVAMKATLSKTPP